MIRIYERSLCQSYASAYRQGIEIATTGTEEDELLKIADMRKRNPSDSAERRFFMLVEQALGAHQ